MYQLNEKKILNILIILTVSVFFIKIFIFYDHYPLHDEVIVLDRYLEWKSFLRKDHIGNHTLTSFIGVIIKTLFGYNFIIFRFSTFVCFILILIIFRKIYTEVYLYTLFLFFIVSSNVLFNYVYIFRGYYIYALLSVLIFFYLKKYFYNFNNQNYLRLILVLLYAMISHSIFTLYIAIPTILIIFIHHFLSNKLYENIKNYLFYLIIPTLGTYLIFFFLEGFVLLHHSNLNLNFIFENIFSIFVPCVIEGFNSIFFSGYTNFNIIALKETFIKFIYGEDQIISSEPFFLLIYFLSIIIAFYNLLKYKTFNYQDILIILIFLFYIFTFRNPPMRVHIGTIIFCIFFIIDNIKILVESFNFHNKKIVSLSFSILCFFLIISAQPNKNFQQVKNEIIKINKFKHDCFLANQKLDSYEKWILISYYPSSCKYFYDGKNNVLY